MVKPSREIFEYLCRECNIVPSESIFIDDNESNINACRAFGINGYLFDGDVCALEGYLDKILS